MIYQYEFIDGWIIRDLAGYSPADEVSKATIYALANGYMGSRGASELCTQRLPGVVGTYVNGIYDSPTGKVLDREMVNLPTWTAMALEVDGEVLTLDQAHTYIRQLDMRPGLMRQTIRWRTARGVEITLESERLLSAARKHLAAIQWRFEATETCRIAIASSIDADVSNRWADSHFTLLRAESRDAEIAVYATTLQEKYEVHIRVLHRASQPVVWESSTSETRADTRCCIDLSPGVPLILEKYAAIYDSRFSQGELSALCQSEIRDAEQAQFDGLTGYDAIRAEHATAWTEAWAASNIQIDGDEQAQIALRFCLFHLLATAPHDDRVSVTARGLQGQDYWGSVFWDCEIYVLPFFIYTQPAYARRCLMYRYHTLDGARRKGRSLGYRGAYYAWQSQETGDETCELYVFDDPRTGQKIRSYFADEQIHISADISYAVWQYYQATSDETFLAAYGLEILCEVARFYASRLAYNPTCSSYELRTVLGPDEYHERIDNNAYTNVLARNSLILAVQAIEHVRPHEPEALERLTLRIGLTDGEIAEWQRIADAFYIPEPDPTTGVIEQFDGYFKLEDAPPDVVNARLEHPDQYPGGLTGPFQATQAIKQADVVLLLYLMRQRYSVDVKRANWEYYEPRTAHDSSLSAMAYALVAADIGMTDWAYRYLMQTATIDLIGSGPHWNLGVHTAALGGAWQAVVQGFCHVDLRESGVHLLAPPILPAGWRRVAFSFYWHGHQVQFWADDKHVEVKALSGSVPLSLWGDHLLLEAGNATTFRIG